MSSALVAPNVVGYPFDQAPNLASAEERGQLSASAIKAFVNIAAKWGLNEAQSRGLISSESPHPVPRLEDKPQGQTAGSGCAHQSLPRHRHLQGPPRLLRPAPGLIAGCRWRTADTL